jgi:indole-3-glycerol phosphate synthase
MSESKSILDEICQKKREHVAAQKKRIPLAALKEKIETLEKPRGFIKALKTHKFPAIIAEVKKASPSVGIIRENFDAIEIARAYGEAGAACLSVLTDEPYFQGKDEYLVDIRKSVSLPLLRKDFIIDEYQLFESRALGADCVLLIMAALTNEQARYLYQLSQKLGMDILVEVHDEEELIHAMDFAPQMVGVNNRNLKTLKVDVQTSHTLAKKIPADVVRVAESGISDPQTINALRADGYHAFLIGESLMKQDDIGTALKKFTMTS